MLKQLFHFIAKVLANRNVFFTKSLSYRNKKQVLPPNFDYIRFATLGLLFEEITARNIQGNIAEVGVYQGDFASRLNLLFPNRKLYLFDTFEGFHQIDKVKEQTKGFSNAAQDFSDTSVDKVLSKMPYPNQCIVRKGYFPETAADVSDTFCLVSLDTDLYEPIKNGLQFFYPKLSNGGFIMIHDFNNDLYIGARKAVAEFCELHGIWYCPIPDSGGTVIIGKS